MAKAARKPKRKVGKKIPVQDLSALKDNVMNELEKETESSKTQKPVKVEPILAKDISKKPFDNVLLPEEKKPTALKKNGTFPLLILGAAILIWLGLFVFVRGKPESSVALENIVMAVESHDVQSFSRHVDIEAVSENVAAQMFVAPEMSSDLPDVVRDQIMAMQNRFDTVIKPALVDDLRAEILHYVETGEFIGDGQVPTMLTGLMGDLLGDSGTVSVRDAQEEGSDAVATVLITRPDLAIEKQNVQVPLTILMHKKENAWQVIGLPNLDQALVQIEKAEEAFAAAQQGEVVAQLARVLSVEKLTKASVGESAMLVAMGLKNTSQQAITQFTGKVIFTDAGGRVMKEINLADKDGVAAGDVISKTWTVPMNTAVSAERHLLVLPMSSIKAVFKPQSVTFEDGSVLAIE